MAWRTINMMSKKERHDVIAETGYDLYINLLNHGSYEEIGKAVVDRLIETKANKYMSRKIVVCGS
jgi:hypothetical protein